MRHPQLRTGAAVVAAALAVSLPAGCGGAQSTGGSASAPAIPSAISVHSSAFADGGTLPARYTCDGAGDIPPLSWTHVPAKTRALAVIVDDPDAPGGTFTHWILLDIPAATRSVAQGDVSSAAHSGKNSSGSTGWTPPCPPSGDGAHHYRFTVYALGKSTGLPRSASVPRARAAIDRLAVARGRLVATYARGG